MKLSELSTDRAADALCEISAFLLNILTDEALRDSLKKQIDAEQPQTAGEKYAIGVQKIGQWVPLILKKHRDDVCGILAAINSVSIGEIRAQSLAETMRQMKDLAEDKDLIDFFKSCASAAKV